MKNDFKDSLENQTKMIEKLKECMQNVEKYRHIFEEAPDPVLLVSGENGNITDINEACILMTGYEREDLIGKHYSGIFSDFTDKISDVNNVVMYDNAVSSRFIKKKTGENIPVDMTLSTFSNHEEHLIIIFIRDVTERAASQEKLEKTNRELTDANITKDKFFTIISHDLKNLFGALMGFSDLLRSDYNDLEEDEKKFFIERITNISKSSFDLLENLLQWSGSQTGSISFNPEELQLENVIKNTLKVILPQADAKNIEVRNIFCEDMVIAADKNMLQCIMRNLVSNAVKFTPYGGEVDINACKTGNEIVISVKDNGIGIPEDKIDEILNHKHNLTSKGTADESGTGLGLMLCKEFIEKHGGKLSITSQPGKGSEFSFNLPVTGY